MPRKALFRTIEVGDEWQPLSETSLIAKFEVLTPPSNSSNVLIRRVGETDQAAMIPAQFQAFESVDLSSIEVQGSDGDVIQVIGQEGFGG
jgi:hypothetical protein